MRGFPPGTVRAAHDVLTERFRQQDGEGFPPEHDDGYVRGELIRAAVCYATTALVRAELVAQGMPAGGVDAASARAALPGSWPWAARWWKPRDARANLVRAAALIIAEIERLDRAAERAKQ